MHTVGEHGQASGRVGVRPGRRAHDNDSMGAQQRSVHARHGVLAAWSRCGIEVATWAFGCGGAPLRDTNFGFATRSDLRLGDLLLGVVGGIGHSVSRPRLALVVSRHTFGVATWVWLP